MKKTIALGAVVFSLLLWSCGGDGSPTASSPNTPTSTPTPVATSIFYLAPNGVMVMCPDAAVGDTGTVGGVIYTKRSKAQIDALVDAEVYAHLTTTCTSGVTDMKQLFYYATSFNGDIKIGRAHV